MPVAGIHYYYYMLWLVFYHPGLLGESAGLRSISYGEMGQSSMRGS